MVHYTQGSGGLFSSFLPQLLGLAVKGPWGAVAGNLIGGLADGAPLGQTLGNTATAALNANWDDDENNPWKRQRPNFGWRA